MTMYETITDPNPNGASLEPPTTANRVFVGGIDTSVDITNAANPARRIEPCPVPGCGQMLTQYQRGPHLKKHRNAGDPGTPPPKHESVQKANRKAKAAKNPLEPCTVPGCDRMIHRNAMGTHLRMHRAAGDPGTPPPTTGAVRKANLRAKVKVDAPVITTPPAKRPYTSKPKPPLTAHDVTDGVLALLYPAGVPLDRLRAVTAWVTVTEQLAVEAFAAQTEVPQP